MEKDIILWLNGGQILFSNSIFNYNFKRKVKEIKMNNSRRNFISYAGRLSMFFTIFYFSGKFWNESKKINDDEELVVVNGWILKKSDLI